MKKILILISILVSMTGSVVFYSQNKQEETPKPEQVNVSEKKAEEKVAEIEESKENEMVEDDKIPEQKQDEVKEEKTEVKSDPKPENNNVSSASNSKTKTENKTNNSVVKDTPKETQKEAPKETPKENNTTPSSNSTNTQPQKNNVTTTFYDSITGGKKEFSSESAANARGYEIQNNEMNYVLDYNEQHPDAPIQPDINYFRVYPSAIDENGQYWYYLHFFCASGEGNDAKLKSIY